MSGFAVYGTEAVPEGGGREIRLAIAVGVVGARVWVALRRRRGWRRGSGGWRRAGLNEKVRTGVTLAVTDGVLCDLSATSTESITIMHVFRRNRWITFSVTVAT
jgi:hypothetical protein